MHGPCSGLGRGLHTWEEEYEAQRRSPRSTEGQVSMAPDHILTLPFLPPAATCSARATKEGRTKTLSSWFL